MDLKELLTLIDADLENVQRQIIDLQGGDPGHDIGDCSNALELLSNQITEYEEEDQKDFIINLSQAIKTDQTIITPLFDELKDYTHEQWGELHNDLYPNTEPYSGFGPAW